MEIRPVQYADLPALVQLELEDTVAALPGVYPSADAYPLTNRLKERRGEFADPWITFTLAEDERGICGWVQYTENQLRYIMVTDRVQDAELRDELHGEGLRHWKACATPRVWLWVLADDAEARTYYEGQGWKGTRRTRRSGLDPHPILAEYLLTLSE